MGGEQQASPPASPSPRPGSRLAEADLPLIGVRVLDLTDDSGYLCGRALADLGADVVKVEPPSGDPGRRVPPFADDRPEMERSLTWLAGNANKRGITCNLQTASGRDLFRRLAAHTDVVLESFTPGYLDSLSLGYDALSADHPGLILSSVTPYGQSGPDAQAPASDIEITASSGSLWVAGDPDRPPVRSTLPVAPSWGGLFAAAGTTLAVLVRALTGRGQHVDTSSQAAMVTAISHAPIYWDLLREEQTRSGPFLVGRSVTGAKFRNIWVCKDGYVTFALYGGPAGRNTHQALTRWMNERGTPSELLNAMDWAAFDTATAEQEQVDLIEAEIAPFFLTLTRQEFFKGVVARNMLGYSVATMEDVWLDEQLRARDFWDTVVPPWGGAPLPFPGAFALFDGQRPAIRRSAPRLGEHNVEVYAELGLGDADLAVLRSADAI